MVTIGTPETEDVGVADGHPRLDMKTSDEPAANKSHSERFFGGHGSIEVTVVQRSASAE